MGINFKGVLKCTLFSVIITFIIILILALLSYFTRVGETVITVGVYASVIIGVLLGSIAVAKAAPQKAFLHVMLLCLIYVLLLIGISWIINGTIVFNSHFLAVVGGAFGAGFLGLIIGK
ncbi:MAG: TIGR04086 family membrane protein [Clostridia bacterium]|nr:TIGR04086 family membrane protein [Clostridia bacterium]